MDQPFLTSELEQGWGILTPIPGGEKAAPLALNTAPVRKGQSQLKPASSPLKHQRSCEATGPKATSKQTPETL